MLDHGDFTGREITNRQFGGRVFRHPAFVAHHYLAIDQTEPMSGAQWSSANGRLAPCLRGVLERSGRQNTVLSDTGYKATAIGSGVSRNPHRWDAAKLWRNRRSIRGSKSRSATRVRSASANSGRVAVSPTQTRCREIQPWPVVGKKREPRLTGQPGPSVCMRGQRV